MYLWYCGKKANKIWWWLGTLFHFHCFHVHADTEKVENTSLEMWRSLERFQPLSSSSPRFILIPPLPCINVSLLYYYVYGIPPASIYRDLGAVFWGLHEPIMSLSHYEPGQREIILIIGATLGQYLNLYTPILPSCLFICAPACRCQQRVSCYPPERVPWQTCETVFRLRALPCRLTPELGYAVQPSSAVATRVSITVSAAKRKGKTVVSHKKKAILRITPPSWTAFKPQWSLDTITDEQKGDEPFTALHPSPLNFC